MEHRAGTYHRQVGIHHLGTYMAYVAAPLPPDPPIDMNSRMIRVLSEADQALGRLDGIARTLPNLDLFVAMYVRREAVLSSQIEGTQSTMDDLLKFELDEHSRGLPQDVHEVVNYVSAMNYGLDRLSRLPLSLRLIREIHAELLKGGRGAEKSPGEFRVSQNWKGPLLAADTDHPAKDMFGSPSQHRSSGWKKGPVASLNGPGRGLDPDGEVLLDSSWPVYLRAGWESCREFRTEAVQR
jgi:hypothetical protein